MQIRNGEKWLPASGNVELVIHDAADQFRSGDQVRVFGRLVRSSPPTNPGQFDFSHHYRRQRLLAFVHVYEVDSVEVLVRADVSLYRLRSSLRRRLDRLIWYYVGPTEAPFASAILLGNRQQMDKDRRDKFVETGTVHLLAISGLHVGILAGSFLMLLRLPFFSRKQCLLATIVFVIFYAWLVEFRPPVTRASILIVLYCIGRWFGVQGFSLNLLASAAVIVLMINPADLFGIGPQLSFLAVATLTMGAEMIFWPRPEDPLQRLIANTRSYPVKCWNEFWRNARTAVLVSLAIWLVALPLVANRFHVVAFSSVYINPLLLLPIAFGLYGGLATLAFGWWCSPIARVGGWVCERNLALIEWMVGGVQANSFSHRWTAGPTDLSAVAFYVGLLLIVNLVPQAKYGRWLVSFFALWFVLGWWLPEKMARYGGKQELVCTFVDVGHGSGVVLQFPNGENWLYDGGALGAANYGSKSLAGVLWDSRIGRIDTIVVSHADVDHFNALPGIVEKFSVGRVLVSQQMRESDAGAVKRLFDQFEALSIPIEEIKLGDQFQLGPTAAVRIFAPTLEGFGENDNADSVVMLVEHQSYKLLLPGDLEKSGLDYLLQQAAIDCDVVMAAHHGSGNSSPEQFMNWATPEYVVISGGSRRVTAAMEARFAGETSGRSVLRTDRDGAVRVRCGQSGISVRHWEVDRWVQQAN
jgi:competence protein ComEC